MSQDPEKDINEVRKALLEKISQKKISDFKGIYEKKPIILESNTDPKKAIEILIKNKVRAAPVREKNEWVGVIDLRDTVKYALQTYKQGSMDKIKAKAMEYLTTAPHISTNSLKYLARMAPFKMVKDSESIMKLIELMSQGNHIVGIIKNDSILSIVTQGQLFSVISNYWDNNDKFVDIELKELSKYKYITSPIKTIRYDVKAYEAFEKMSQYNLSGLAVVDEEGKIIHNTSATDIKLWLDSENSLDETIETFLINIRKQEMKENIKYPIVFCLENDKLSKALGKLKATRYHRLWIVDDNHCPIGVFALTDLFKFLIHNSDK